MAGTDILRVGTDPNGRGIFMSRRMWRWWRRCVRRLGFEPTIVQGAHMVRNGGGAKASAGYHDGGGCLDLRLWDRTERERAKMIRVFRLMGAGYWERTKENSGMDLHAHLVFGSDVLMTTRAKNQWLDYVDGLDGLARRGKDYHWRPEPLVLVPPPTSRRLRDILKDAHAEAVRIGRHSEGVKRLQKRIGKW